MYSQLEEKNKQLLNAVKANPDCSARELADICTKTNTLGEVTSGLWGLWNGRYITRKKSDKKADSGMTPFVYQFKTEKPRMKKRGKAKRKYVRKSPQSRVNEVFNPTVTPTVTPTPTSTTYIKPAVELLIAVEGVKETLTLTPAQARELFIALKDLLGA